MDWKILVSIIGLLLFAALVGESATTLGGPYASDVDTVALYHLDNFQGSLVEDATDSGNDGILFGSSNININPAKYYGGLEITSNPGGFNAALSFAGRNFTVEGWFKPLSVNTTQYLFVGKGSNGENIFYLRQQVVSSIPMLVCGVYDPGAGIWREMPGGNVAVNTWYHVALTVSNSGYANTGTNDMVKICLYQNNILKNSGIYEFSAMPLTVENLKIGRGMWDDVNYCYSGAMDEIRISNTPRYSFSLPLNSPLNLVDNGHFETPDGSFPASWSSQVISGSAMNSWNTTQYVSNGHSVKTAMSVSGQAYWSQVITDVDNSSDYRLRAHVYATDVASGSHAVELHWQNTSGVDLRIDSYMASVANQWVECKAENITPPEETAQVIIRLRSNVVGTFYFDDVVLERKDNNLHLIDGKFPLGLYYLPTIHLLQNSGFKLEGNTGLPLGWVKLFSSGTAEQTWDTGRYVSGTHSLKTVVSADGQSDWRQYVYDINPSLTYKLSGNIYATNTVSGSHCIAVQWLNSSGAFLGQTALASATANQWTAVSQSDIVPITGAVKAVVVLRAYKVGTYNFDDVNFDVDWTAADVCSDIKNAGFNYVTLLSSDASGFAGCASAGLKTSVYPIPYTMYLPDGCPIWWQTELIAEINSKEADSTVALWCAYDEPNIHECTVAGMLNAYNVLVANDDYFSSAPHKVWMLYAPLGMSGNPYDAQDFSLLRDYNAGGDIVGIDVYPVPEGCGYSNLPNQTISSVGDYVDILYNQVANWENASVRRKNQIKPVWMALQGYGKDDYWKYLSPYLSHGIEIQWYNASNSYLSSFRLPATVNGAWCYEFAHDIAPPAGATKAYVILRAYAAGTYYFDSIDFREVGGSNMLVNPSFEQGSGDVPDGWTNISYAPYGSASFSWDTNQYASGSRSVKVTMWNSAHFSCQADWRQVADNGAFTVSDTKKYSLSGYVLSQRGPSWAQTRFMAYNAIIHGARGIIYYGNEAVSVNSPLWNDLKGIASELDGLSQALIAPRSFREVTISNGTIEYLLLETNDYLYLFTANRSPLTINNVSMEISGLPLTAITRICESGSLTISSNSFIDNFSAYQVHVYQIQK